MPITCCNVSDLQRIGTGVLIFLYVVVIISFGPIILVLLFVGNIYVKIVCALYLLFIVYDRNICDRGGRRALSWARNWCFWKFGLNYFPVDLVKTADLPADRNYLVCIFPHGYLSIGAFLNFVSNHSKWSLLFPGIRPKFTSLVMNHYAPVYRELLLSLGGSSVSAKSLTAILSHSNNPNDKSNRDGFTSSAAGLIVGGEREQRQTLPNAYKFVLKNRKGFVRIALKTGASLVPGISFGENDIFQITRFRLIRFNGHVPITTVIGKPIHMQKNVSPTEDEVNEIHELFCTQIKELFDEHKSKYVENFDQVQLELV